MILICGFLLFSFFNKGMTVEPFATEKFIEKWLKNDNGTFATYMKDTPSIDEDLVKGREALAESIGLWMEYALVKEDKKLFDQSFVLLNDYFLEKSGFIHWKVTETGQSKVSSNALVDDLRITLALFQAAEKWNDKRYEKTAVQISKYITKNNLYENVLTDFYEKNDEYASHTITLSYIEPEAFKQLKNRSLIDETTYTKMLDILKNMPIEGAFFPKNYNVDDKKYYFDQKINIVDQSLVALYRAKSSYSTTQFIDFIRNEINTHGVIYGQYNKDNGKPAVKYESPAIYGWLILYCLEIGDEKLARILFDKMRKFQNRGHKYVGGYSIYENNTHIFDNLVPLLAERKLDKEGLLN